MPERLDPARYRDLVRRALAEDVKTGDITTNATIDESVLARATLVAGSRCVIAGLDVVAEVFAQVDAALRFTAHRQDGDRCDGGEAIAGIQGSAKSILVAERTALNFIQHLSGIATLTREFVDAAAGRVTILDTRKTIPLLRELAKYAVRCGGGTNHRMGLFDAVLIKDNHIHVAGSVGEAVRRARAQAPGMTIEVEAQSLEEVDQAVSAGADVIMLDNLDAAQMREAVRRIGGRARTEISGGVTLESLVRLRDIGADSISIGALTHSAPAADMSLDVRIER